MKQQTLREKKRLRMQYKWKAYKAGMDDGRGGYDRKITLSDTLVRDYLRGYKRGQELAEQDRLAKLPLPIKLWNKLWQRK